MNLHFSQDKFKILLVLSAYMLLTIIIANQIIKALVKRKISQRYQLLASKRRKDKQQN